jgi:putative transposase
MRGRHRSDYEKHGNVFFVTFTVVGFVAIFDFAPCCDIIIENLQFYQDKGDFTVLAYIIMPNHVHLVLCTRTERTISDCIGNLKRITSRQISALLMEKGMVELQVLLGKSALEEPADDCRIWKPRFDCFVLNNIETLSRKIKYIHNNPVKAGLVARSIEWPYSSASAYDGLPGGRLPVDSDWSSIGFDFLQSGKGSRPPN